MCRALKDVDDGEWADAKEEIAKIGKIEEEQVRQGKIMARWGGGLCVIGSLGLIVLGWIGTDAKDVVRDVRANRDFVKAAAERLEDAEEGLKDHAKETDKHMDFEHKSVAFMPRPEAQAKLDAVEKGQALLRAEISRQYEKLEARAELQERAADAQQELLREVLKEVKRPAGLTPGG